MIDFENNWTQIGDYAFNRHEGDLQVASLIEWDIEDLDYYGTPNQCLTYHPVDFFSDLIDALYYFKKEGLDIKLTGEEFKQLIEGSHASLYYGSCSDDVDNNFDCSNISCDDCKYHNITSDWVNFNRYDFIKDYGAFRRLVLIRDDYKCLCCGNDNEKELQVHHIRAFKDNLELATSVKNGATLCKDCHTKYHKKYGWKGKQETFSKFIKEMLD